ncbi:Bug family tripartite tricarboxylate transporter substrate binding protein [Paracraurococcus lichenis]|uniref:Tripartite tricarboxylate transporter substrate binding protein n=1 Tax=Paracraurococcus lichenis TaxID=3064888 RepID=A0ABT9DZB1_9PROT|nr:tripartite tricarboxylate transporter substrate binding protein [Paracraurococcus sp. LOR1-02]MDO9709243.1 tripartite tricarboxylate transporter substrate binding protein [Paracraurococcus sp. LOR1-02]
MQRRALLAASLALPLAVRAPIAHAQGAWPDRPVRFVVPWPPGGLNDLVARAFNDPVSRALGQPIVNDFRSGAGGRIGVAEVARAAPDGYTIGMGNLGPLTIFPHLFKDIPYDAGRDLVPVVMFAASPLVLVVANDVPAKTVPEFIAWIRSRPGHANYASVGVGTAQHLIFEMFRQRDGIAMEHVPFRGTNESLPAMMRGDIQAMFDTLPLMLPQIRDGAVRALAVTTPVRVPQLPDVPTLIESGYPDIDVSTWYAVIAPAGTPAPILERLHREYVRVALLPETQQFLAAQGLIYLPNDPGVFAARVAAERARWGEIIRSQGIKVE